MTDNTSERIDKLIFLTPEIKVYMKDFIEQEKTLAVNQYKEKLKQWLAINYWVDERKDWHVNYDDLLDKLSQ